VPHFVPVKAYALETKSRDCRFPAFARVSRPKRAQCRGEVFPYGLEQFAPSGVHFGRIIAAF